MNLWKLKRFIRKEFLTFKEEWSRMKADILRWKRSKINKDDSHERWVDLSEEEK